MRDPAILGLRRRITLVASEELMHARPRRQAIVAVKTRDGRSLSRRTLAVRGTADNPMSQAEVEAKALELIGGALGARRAKAMVQAMRKLASIPDVRALRRLWQPAKTAKAATQGRVG
jgi:2-methylcitrate dehydratase PrpD